MKRLAAFLVTLLLALAASATTLLLTDGGTGSPALLYSTVFPLTENPISEGGVWHGAGASWTNVATTPGFAHGTQGGSGGTDDSNASLTGYPPDQEVELTVTIGASLNSTNREIEALLRWTPGSETTGYECLVQHQGSYVYIVRWDGPFNTYTVLTAGGVTTSSLSTGDRFRCRIIGTVISWQRNVAGAWVDMVTHDTAGDTSPGSGRPARFSTGNPGFAFYMDPGASNTDVGASKFTARSL